MTIKLAVVMDPLQKISDLQEESTYSILVEAKKRAYVVYLMTPQDLYVQNGIVWARASLTEVTGFIGPKIILKDQAVIKLTDMSVVLMRKDPPVDMEYVYTTYLLDLVENAGTLVLNRPSSLRNLNEKIFASWFKDYCPPTLVTSQVDLLKDFLLKHEKIIIKSLNGMAGNSIYCLEKNSYNTDIILKTTTNLEKTPIMAQKFIPEIKHGDKRIIIIDGKPIPEGIARIPAANDIRGNLRAGATAVKYKMTPAEYQMCEKIGNKLKEFGVIFAGIDIIGDFLTEINVTSPGCIPEIDHLYDANISAILLDAIEKLCL